MRTPRLVTIMATFAVLALPAGAHAQGAADNQYQDPFGNSAPTSRSVHHSSTPRSSPAPRAAAPAPTPPAPAPVVPSASAPAASPPVQSASSGVSPSPAPARSASSPPTLPYTGFNALQEALAGGVLLLLGLGLRVRTRLRGVE